MRSKQPREQASGGRPVVLAFLQGWAISTVAMLVATHLVSGIRYDKSNLASLFVASLLFGVLVTFLRPLLMVLTFPLVVVTLGLFRLVINAGLLFLVGWLVEGFYVDGFWPAFWGALVISLVTILLNTLTGGEQGAKAQARQRAAAAKQPPKRDDDGPVIDV